MPATTKKPVSKKKPAARKKAAPRKKKATTATTPKATDVNTNPETEETEETTPEIPMSVALKCKTWQRDIDPTVIETKHNIRPVNKNRATEISHEIEDRGLDRNPWVVEIDEDTFWTLDGGHRITALAILKKRNPGRFAELFPTGEITVECRAPFDTDLEYHLAQIQLNEGQENISNNAVDAGFACAKLESEGANQATIATALKVSPAWVSRHLKAHHKVIGPIKTMVKNGKLSGKTLLDAAHGTEGQQKKLLEKLQKALKGLKGKEYKQTERSIVEAWVRRLKKDGDKARFPKKRGKADLAHNMFDLYSRIDGKKKSEMSDYHIEVRGMLKGVALVFGEDADDEDFDIVEWFRNAFGREITAEENAQ